MRYLGGKQRIAKQIGAYLQNQIGNRPYWEPFVGGASVLCQIDAPHRLASDANDALIDMWQALAAGWEPPDTVTEDDYLTTRALGPEAGPIYAFTAIGCSFGGKWWGGYARGGDGRNYAMNAKNSLKKKMKQLGGVVWRHGPYWTPPMLPSPVAIYCDPPYAGMTGYADMAVFDHIKFWEWVRARSREGHIVIVSEYDAPEDFDCVLEIPTKTDLHGIGRSGRVERLFRYAG
jgi:DNA adenine methylase